MNPNYSATTQHQYLHLRRAVRAVDEAKTHLLRASRTASNRHDKNRLRFFSEAMRDFENPELVAERITRFANAVGKGGR